jgi:hypothetical protein
MCRSLRFGFAWAVGVDMGAKATSLIAAADWRPRTMLQPDLLRRSLRLVGALLASGLLFACQTPYERRDPTGEVFPSVSGTSLNGEATSLPQSLAGEPALLLIGFEQESQFDLDRWALGLWQSGFALRVIEVPTIPGIVPRVISDRIDDGMRSGIPMEDWASVITVYRDADAIVRFTGNANPRPGRVLLLNAASQVAYFYDRGYSTGALARLMEAVGRLELERP